MSHILKNEKIPTDHINEVLDEIEKLYIAHNITRSLVDMVKDDEILNIFYSHSRDINFLQSSTQDKEAELFILRKTLQEISNYIRYISMPKSNTTEVPIGKDGDILVLPNCKSDIGKLYNFRVQNKINEIINKDKEE